MDADCKTRDLQRQIVQLRRALQLIGAGLCGVLLLGQATAPKSLMADALVLNDPEGRKRVELTATSMGGVIRLYDQQERVVLELGEGPKGVGLTAYDQQGVTLLSISVSQGRPLVVLSHAESSAILSGISLRLGAAPGRTLELGQIDVAQKTLGLVMSDGNRLPVVLSHSSSGAMLGLASYDRKAIVGAGPSDSGLYLSDSSRLRSSLALTDAGPGLVLYDEQGRSLYTRP